MKPWTHKQPYPTNPFQRVSGKELQRLHRLLQKQQTQQLPEALL
jgi:hypothetical protein